LVAAGPLGGPRADRPFPPPGRFFCFAMVPVPVLRRGGPYPQFGLLHRFPMMGCPQPTLCAGKGQRLLMAEGAASSSSTDPTPRPGLPEHGDEDGLPADWDLDAEVDAALLALQDNAPEVHEPPEEVAADPKSKKEKKEKKQKKAKKENKKKAEQGEETTGAAGEAAGEVAKAPEEPRPQMGAADWATWGTEAWDAEKWSAADVAKYLLSFPQAPSEKPGTPRAVQEDSPNPRKRQGPHGESAEDMNEKQEISRVYLVTAPHPESAELKAPGSLTRNDTKKLILAAVKATDENRTSPLEVQKMVVAQERHSAGEIHYHVAIVCGRPFRFAPLKKFLRETHFLATHWSAHGTGYHSAVAYLYVPSPKKPLKDLDPSPLRWASEGGHPPLAEASRAPVSASGMFANREKTRLTRAEEGKPEGRFRAVHIWPLVVAQNFKGQGARERLVSYAKACGGQPMVDFLFENFAKVPDLIARSWEFERCEEYIVRLQKTRSQIVMEHLTKPCACAGRWLPAASQLLERNNIDPTEFRNAMVRCLEEGRSKGALLCFVGRHGTEGKSWLLEPIPAIFGAEYVFTTPSKGNFPLLDLEKARVVVLDDWRFNELILSYNLQLLWFEGKPIVIARPQNEHSGHIKYDKDDPIFISCLESDLLATKPGIQQGDVDMMLKRLKVFLFKEPIENPVKIPPCGRCWATLLYGPADEEGKRKAAASAHRDQGESPAKKKAADWTTDEVVGFLEGIGLPQLETRVRESAVDGELLCSLSKDELVADLGLTALQAMKVLQRLK
jgi:hypothetical protein